MNSLLSKKEMIEKLKKDKVFREAFAMEYVKNSIPSQLRALRKERGWTQADLGRETKKPRNVITRLENPNNNIPNLYTMLEMAWGCEAALLVKVIPFSELLKEYEKPFEAMYAEGISDEKEAKALLSWADKIEEDLEEVEKKQQGKTKSIKIQNTDKAKPYKYGLIQGKGEQTQQLPLFRPQSIGNAKKLGELEVKELREEVDSNKSTFQEIEIEENINRNTPQLALSTDRTARAARAA